MTRIPSTLNPTAADRSPSSVDAINDLDLGTFLELMITELQNQDPLNPLDNKDMLAQISQIREVGATDKLTKTLESVLLGQNIANATNLIGSDITALSDDLQPIAGLVSQVSIDNGSPKLHVDINTEAAQSDEKGNMAEGTYAYRVIWDEGGTLFGIEFAGNKAVDTTGADGAVAIQHLPTTSGPKHIYRTDSSGEGLYKLVGVLNEGSQSSFVDTRADAERIEQEFSDPFQRVPGTGRSYQISLNNVSGIRPPAQGPRNDE